MPPLINSAMKRSKSYWLRDGIPEIVLGVYFALAGALLAFEAFLGDAGRLIGAYGLPIVIVGGTLSMPAIIKALKSRITYPRTGYVVHRQAGPRHRRTAALAGALAVIAVVAGVSLLAARDAVTGWPIALLVTGAILSTGYLVAGFRSGEPRLFLVAVAAGASVAVCGSLVSDDAIGMAVLFVAVGLVQAVLGLIVLRRYLASTSVPDPEAEHNSEDGDDRSSATVHADAQDTQSGTGALNQEQPRGA